MSEPTEEQSAAYRRSYGTADGWDVHGEDAFYAGWDAALRAPRSSTASKHDSQPTTAPVPTSQHTRSPNIYVLGAVIGALMDHTFDEEVNAYYFSADGSKGDVCRTSTIPGCTVNIDWGHYGNVIGIEVIAPTSTQ